MNNKPVHNIAARRKWAAAHASCQACGIAQNTSGFPILETHHIIRRSRSDEPCNLLRLDSLCHRLASGDRIRNTHTGRYYENLTLAQQVALKRLREPEEANEARLVELRHGEALPPEEMLPAWFNNEWHRNTGERR